MFIHLDSQREKYTLCIRKMILVFLDKIEYTV